MNESINESINDKAVYRTAPATPGLLKTMQIFYNKNATTSQKTQLSNNSDC